MRKIPLLKKHYLRTILISLFALTSLACTNSNLLSPTSKTAMPPVTPSRLLTTPRAITTTLISTPRSTSNPSLIPTSPTLDESDLQRYFSTGWPRRLPQWVLEPPGNRQVLLEGEGSNSTLSLLDREGNLVIRFTEAEGEYPPGRILWSRSKNRAIIEFYPAASTVISFFIIDQDGNQLSDLYKAFWGPLWSPREDLLAFQSTDDRLYVVDGDGSVQLVTEPFSPRLCSSCSIPPLWSPNGSRIAFIAKTGEMAVTSDIPLCLLALNGVVCCTSLMDFHPGSLDAVWLDNSTFLVQSVNEQAEGPSLYRYFVFDAESEIIYEVASGSDLTPTPLPMQYIATPHMSGNIFSLQRTLTTCIAHNVVRENRPEIK